MHTIFGSLVAVGLIFSAVGSWRGMRATPLVGVKDGYLAMPEVAEVDELQARQARAWQLLLAGFVLQLLGAVGLVLLP